MKTIIGQVQRTIDEDRILATALTHPEFTARIKAMLDDYDELQPERPGQYDDQWENYASMQDRADLIERHFSLFDGWSLKFSYETVLISGMVISVGTIFVVNYDMTPSVDVPWFSRLGSYSKSQIPTRASGASGHAHISAKRALMVALGLMNWNEMQQSGDAENAKASRQKEQIEFIEKTMKEIFSVKTVSQLSVKLSSKNNNFHMDNRKRELQQFSETEISAIYEECLKYHAGGSHDF